MTIIKSISSFNNIKSINKFNIILNNPNGNLESINQIQCNDGCGSTTPHLIGGVLSTTSQLVGSVANTVDGLIGGFAGIGGGCY